MEINDTVYLKRFETIEEGNRWCLLQNGLPTGYTARMCDFTGPSYPYRIVDLEKGLVKVSSPVDTLWVNVHCILSSAPRCECPIMLGCTCGAFQREMVAKGKKLNPWTRLYE